MIYKTVYKNYLNNSTTTTRAEQYTLKGFLCILLCVFSILADSPEWRNHSLVKSPPHTNDQNVSKSIPFFKTPPHPTRTPTWSSNSARCRSEPRLQRMRAARADGRTGGRTSGRADGRAETNILPNPNPLKVKARYEEAYVPKP